MEMRKALAALLIDKPEDVDWSLFDETAQPIKKYFDDYGQLPTYEYMKDKIELEQPDAPWVVYQKELQEEKFVVQSMPALEKFNQRYQEDPKTAILQLRDTLSKIAEPNASVKGISLTKDLSRFERFASPESARYKFGLQPIDDVTGGIAKKGDYVLISARTNVGKSWVTHAIAKNMAVEGLKVGLYSGEMSADEVGARFDSLLTHISNFGLQRNYIQPDQAHFDALAEVKGELIVKTQKEFKRNARPSDLRAWIKEEKLDILFIDQLDNMDADGFTRVERRVEREMLSSQLKSIVEQMDISIIAVSQINRAGANEEPTIDNIAESDWFGRLCTMAFVLKRKDDKLQMRCIKARGFKIPNDPWEFSWDIDKGLLEPIASLEDKVKFDKQLSAAKQRMADQKKQQQQSDEDEELV